MQTDKLTNCENELSDEVLDKVNGGGAIEEEAGFIPSSPQKDSGNIVLN